MKYLLIFCLAVFSFSACQNTASKTDQTTTEEPTDSGESQDDPDLVAITDVIHNFYQWYEDAQEKLKDIKIVNYGGKHLTLNKANVDAYFDKIFKSGFISKEYIEGEKAYLSKWEAEWQKEVYEDGDAPTGLDADRFFCAQDYDIKFWTTAPVGAEGLGTETVKATMSGDEGGSPREQKFELKKENGKWMITKIECAMDAAE